MAMRCCKDSVAMWVIAHDAPIEGQEVHCRWGDLCDDGYARYEEGQWAYHTPLRDRVNLQDAMAKYRAKRVSEALK